MSKSSVDKSELLRLYYVEEKPILEIADHFKLSSEESIRYYLRKKDSNGNPMYKNRNREYKTTDTHNMIQVFNDHAKGDNFEEDLATVAMVTQSKMSKVNEVLKPLWEKRFGRAYVGLEKIITKEDKVKMKSIEPDVVEEVEVGVVLVGKDAVHPVLEGSTLKIKSAERVMLRPGAAHRLKTGVILEVPEGYTAFVMPDANAMNIAVLNLPQVIQPGNNSELVVDVMHYTHGSTTSTVDLKEGSNVAQAVLLKTPVLAIR